MAGTTKLYQYRVTYTLKGKKSNQGIQSKNPEANLALAQEALGILLEIHQKNTEAVITITGITGLTDKMQVWPPLEPLGPSEFQPRDNSNPQGNPPPASSLAGLGSLLTGNNIPPDTTANGLPTIDAINRMKTEELQSVASKLGVNTDGMKFAQLRTVVLSGIKNAVKDAA